ncbi:MAG: SpoIIE family protein phosphatase [Bradymonadaceae bacterium]
MVDRPVDGRSDLYSLGALLFEVATGRPPYRADDINDLLRKHAVADIPRPSDARPRMTSTFDAIVRKLLAKDPDDRYQTASGLLADLERVDEIEETRQNTGAIKLATRDRPTESDELNFVGRRQELETVRQSWRAARSGSGTAVLIEGPPGGGKTRLVQEFIRRLDSPTPVMRGKAQKTERTPFGAIREAIEGYLRTVKRQGTDERERIHETVRRAAGDQAELLANLSSKLRDLFVDVGDVQPVEDQARFYNASAEFLANLADQLGELVLIFDDVQWLDADTREILSRLVSRLDKSPLLVINVSRNDPESLEGRDAALEAMGGETVERIELRPFSEVETNQMVMDYLGGDELDEEFIRRLTTHADGNPFAIKEYVRAMIDQGKLRPTVEGWITDVEQFSDLDLPDDVIDLVIERLRSLDEATVEILRYAATMTLPLTERLLGQILDRSAEEIQQALENARRANLLEPSETGFQFVHDRVREALLEDLGESERREIHELIAEALEEADYLGERERCFALAHHYAQGRVEKQRRRVFETNFEAGVTAQNIHSNEEAYRYFEVALSMAEHLDLESARAYELHALAGTACVYTDRPDEALEHCEAGLSYAENSEQVSRIRALEAFTTHIKGDQPRAYQLFRRTLRQMGATSPTSDLGMVFDLLWRWPWVLVLLAVDATSRSFDEETVQQYRRRAEVTGEMAFSAYQSGNPLGLAWATIYLLHTALCIGGPSRELAEAYVRYSMFIGAMGLAETTEKYVDKGVEMAEQLGDPQTRALCRGHGHASLEFAGLCDKADQLARDIETEVMRHSDTLDRVQYVTHNLFLRAIRGDQHGIREWYARFEDYLEHIDEDFAWTMTYTTLYVYHTLAGRRTEALEARERLWEQEMVERSDFNRQFALIAEMMVRLVRRQFDEQLEDYIDAFLEIGYDDFHNRIAFPTISYIRLEQYRAAERGELEIEPEEAWKAFEEAVGDITPTRAVTPVHTCHLEILEGVTAVHQGDYDEAAGHLDEALKQAPEGKSKWGTWAALREKARLERQRSSGSGELARAIARYAREYAQSEGYVLRARHLEEEFDLEDDEAEGRSTTVSSTTFTSAADGGTTSLRGLTRERYMDALLEVSLACTSSVDPIEQSQATLEALMEVVVAERAAICTLDEESGDLEFQAGLDADGREFDRLEDYSSTVIERARDEGETIVVTGTEEGKALGSRSAVAHELRSIVAIPLHARDRFIGVVYMDNSMAAGAFQEDEVEMLEAICNHVAVVLEMGRTAQLEVEREALRKDLEVTQTVQSLFIPEDLPVQTSDFMLDGFYAPADLAGGDWWWYGVDDQTLTLLIADVTGHGAGPAMLTGVLAASYQTAIDLAPEAEVPEMLQSLHQSFLSVSEGEYSASMTVVELDAGDDQLRYWNAGGPPILVFDEDGNRDVLLRPGARIGFEDFQLGSATRSLAPGDRVGAFTDGLTELPVRESSTLGLEALADLIEANLDQEIEEATDAVFDDIEQRRREGAREDDWTLLMVDRR